MSEAVRSPFGKVLRAYRQQRGLSQAALADLITERAREDTDLAGLGAVSERSISNLEALRSDPSKFVRPRPHTVRVLAEALSIPPGSEEEHAFLAAAELTRQRVPEPAALPLPIERPIFVRDGREDHFQRLKDAWTLSLTKTPQIVLLAGDAGSGKTHMIRQLCMEIQDRDHHVRVGWGECTSGASSVAPYLVFQQAMNHLLGLVDRKDDPAIIPDQDPASQAAAIETLLKVAPALIGTVVDEPALIENVERLTGEYPHLHESLQRVLGVRNATDTSSRLDQMVRLLIRMSLLAPTIVVLEDLHWAGEQTAALLLHLQRQLRERRGVPLLIIGSYRPSDLAIAAPPTRHPLEPVINEIGRQVDDVVVDLGTTIGTDRGRAFIKGLLQELSIACADEDTLAGFLFTRTEGHPLFAMELIRWLQDTGGMERDDDGSWHLGPAAMEHNAPGKIRAVIAERIDRLPPYLRSILEAASIHGTIVAVDLIAGAEDIPADQFEDAIDNQLVTRYRLLRPRDPYRIGNTRLHLYRFTHALFQEYVYETLSLRERERLHRLSAEKAVRILGDAPHDLSGEIAYHFERAHQYKDAAKHAYHAANHALRKLDYDLAGHWLRFTEKNARQVDDCWHVYAAQNGQVAVMRVQGDFDSSIDLATAVAASARRGGYRDLEAESEDLLGQVYYDQGGLHSAVRHLKRAVDLRRDLGQHAERSGSEAMLSHTYYRLGAYDDALIHARQAYEIADALGDHAHAAEALLAAGNCEVDLGMYETAIATYERADEIYVRAGEVRGELLTALNTGLCHIQLGHWVEAAAILSRTRDTTEMLRTPRMRSSACHYLSLALEGLGDFAAAKNEINRSLSLRERFSQRGLINDNIATRLRIALAEHDLPAAREYLQRLQAWTNECGGEGLEDPVTAYLSMALAYDTLGDAGTSRQVIEEGYAFLMQRASQIADEAARRSYLENVPANKRLIAWHERGKHPEP